jgi:hypothetical protein
VLNADHLPDDGAASPLTGFYRDTPQITTAETGYA